MLCCRIVNGKKQKHKKQPWSNVECFAFGGGIVRFASLETSFHAANHTIPPPPSFEDYPLCPKDKNRSPLHGEKPLMIKYFLGKKSIKFPETITSQRRDMPLACFKCADCTFASKHAKGMPLRYDAPADAFLSYLTQI